MAYEIIRGLEVIDRERYEEYRRAIAPLLDEAGAAFRYDFDVARTLRSEEGAAITRAFVLRFPSRSGKERFFADPRYQSICERLFVPAVARTVIIAEYAV